MNILSRLLRAAKICQGKDDPRYYLNGIHIYKNKIEATNGHIAIHMTMDKRIRKDLILNIRGVISKKAEYSSFVFGKSNFVKHYDEFGSLISLNVVDVIDGKYPDINRIIPKEFKSVDSIGVKAAYVGLFGKMFNCKFGVAKLQFSGENGAMLLTSTSDNINKEYGNPKFIVMPARID
jgi:DNA polymerase III sliding clamp (beta) subunit (PCNA family)